MLPVQAWPPESPGASLSPFGKPRQVNVSSSHGFVIPKGAWIVATGSNRVVMFRPPISNANPARSPGTGLVPGSIPPSPRQSRRSTGLARLGRHRLTTGLARRRRARPPRRTRSSCRRPLPARPRTCFSLNSASSTTSSRRSARGSARPATPTRRYGRPPAGGRRIGMAGGSSMRLARSSSAATALGSSSPTARTSSSQAAEPRP